ncbi:hypothetical protein CCOS865_04376 [Pseudomonas reidholzensis]|uniref:Lnb N-terminal periplasmic domain-containing protein n=1 Tax=Pseudomonas reidholzensis TaxID=1785162 RepID=A0A383S064_9PSED|nr:DUF4105 domain-containing protein [Pseudomonas reidholzensis]SYX92091.1 hypothetical protein CCOS865_04376 [Pseudomonas reidholzensis]
MRHLLAAGLLAGLAALLLGCTGHIPPAQDSHSACQRTAQCDDWQRYEPALQAFLRGSMANAGSAQHPQADPHQAYLKLKARYLTDPQFACRQPLSHRYLQSLWQLPPSADPCLGPVPFRVKGLTSMENVRWVDPQRVQAVQLLFMGESQQPFSRFGHVALRLVVCAPERVRVGPECAEDVFDHIVLSFAAGIADPTLSLWKGLTGGYAIGLFATDFHDVYQQYTIDEFRSLSALPIVLDDRQKDFLVRALSEVHWHYSNDYRFFSHNCASELQWALNSSTQAFAVDAQPLLPTPRVRPDRLFADAQRQPRFQAAVLDNLKTAEAGGYYFPSAEPYYQHAYTLLAERLAGPEMRAIDGPEGWLAAGSAFRAEQLQLLTQPSMGSPRSALDAYLVLETWAVRKMQRALVNALLVEHGEALLKRMQQHGETHSAPALSCMQALLMPASQQTSETGIPEATSALLAPRCAASQQDLAPGWTTLIAPLLRDDPSFARYQQGLAEIQAALRNIEIAQHTRNARPKE